MQPLDQPIEFVPNFKQQPENQTDQNCKNTNTPPASLMVLQVILFTILNKEHTAVLSSQPNRCIQFHTQTYLYSTGDRVGCLSRCIWQRRSMTGHHCKLKAVRMAKIVAQKEGSSAGRGLTSHASQRKLDQLQPMYGNNGYCRDSHQSLKIGS